MVTGVPTAMTDLVAKHFPEHGGTATGQIEKTPDRADNLGPGERDGSPHVLERETLSEALAARQRRAERRSPAAVPADRTAAHARRGRDADAGWQRPPDPGEMLVRVKACGLNHVEHALSSRAVTRLHAHDIALSPRAMTRLYAHDAPYICGMDAAGTVIAAGDRVTRFALGDEVFGHFLAESWAWVQAPCARTAADGPHVERRPEGLDPIAAAGLAEAGLAAKTIMRAAEPRPGQTALVIGATCRVGTMLVPLLAEAGTTVIAASTPADDDYVRALGAADTIEYTTTDPVTRALAAHPDADLLVDLVSFGEPYFITAAAPHGTIVSALPGARTPGIPRIEITAEPGDLAALAQRALDGRQPVAIGRC
jgi:NADPH:quinone reductase-like Zn-dependent oxidoreductase